MTKVKKLEMPNVVGPSSEEWLTLNAEYVFRRTFSGVRRDGIFFNDQKDINVLSIDILEFAKNKSHIHKVDGIWPTKMYCLFMCAAMEKKIIKRLLSMKTKTILVYKLQKRKFLCRANIAGIILRWTTLQFNISIQI